VPWPRVVRAIHTTNRLPRETSFLKDITTLLKIKLYGKIKNINFGYTPKSSTFTTGIGLVNVPSACKNRNCFLNLTLLLLPKRNNAGVQHLQPCTQYLHASNLLGALHDKHNQL